jgi:hypothetical protein
MPIQVPVCMVNIYINIYSSMPTTSAVPRGLFSVDFFQQRHKIYALNNAEKFKANHKIMPE